MCYHNHGVLAVLNAVQGPIIDKTIRLFLSLVLCLLAVSFSFAEDAEKDEADKKLEAAIENLESPNWYLRGSAILDLVQHEDEKVDKGIERALESNYPFVKLAACKAIRLRKMENMLDKVVEVCLDSTYVAVVDSAAKTIASLNSEEGFKKLYEAWNERSGRPGLNFGRSLRYFKDVDLEGLIEKIVKNNKSEMLTAYTIEAATVNGIHTDRLEQSVLSIKPKTAVLQYCMSEYLSTCPDSKAAVNYLMNQIKSREAPIAMRAGTSLAKLKHSNPDDLMSYARKKANPPSSNAALKAIALNHYAPDASKVSSLLSDKHSRDRISGCIYVAKFPSKRLLQHVEKLALSDEDEQVRLYAMRTLVLQDPETATKAIGNLLESSDDINRITALMGIAYTRDEKHMPLVIKAFSNGLSQRAAAAAGYALLCLNPASALEEMEALLKKNDADIAMPVIIALGQLPFGKSVELLISTLNTNFEAIRNASSEQLMLLTGCNFPPQQKVWNKWWEKKKEYLDPFNSRWLPVPEKEKEDGEDEKDDEGKVEKGLEQVFLWHKPKTSLFTSIADRRKETVKKFDNAQFLVSRWSKAVFFLACELPGHGRQVEQQGLQEARGRPQQRGNGHRRGILGLGSNGDGRARVHGCGLQPR
ncbi:MAG: hypothetical protein U5N86_05690 [Planctomycetota bacterium]|nr:hypothetical protein [Planctomycetota bacterium]